MDSDNETALNAEGSSKPSRKSIRLTSAEQDDDMDVEVGHKREMDNSCIWKNCSYTNDKKQHRIRHAIQCHLGPKNMVVRQQRLSSKMFCHIYACCGKLYSDKFGYDRHLTTKGHKLKGVF